MDLKVGDYVRKNPATWLANDFDSWGRGIGIGQVVEPPFELEADQVDVRWPRGRCFESVDQLLAAETPGRPPT
jgi:hypothetical protein